MKILALAEFDPAGVLRGWARALAKQGHTLKRVVHTTFWREGADAEWIYTRDGQAGLAQAAAFAKEADIGLFMPGISAPWATDPSPIKREDVPDWFRSCRRLVVCFPGSINTWAHAEVYAEHFRQIGFELCAASARYAHRLRVPWLPPVVDVGTVQAQLRRDDEPLRVVHATTDDSLNHTAEVEALCARLGIQLDIIRAVQHDEVLERKAKAHVGYSHLTRGIPSVSTVEDGLIGLGALYGRNLAYDKVLRGTLGSTPDGIIFGGIGADLGELAGVLEDLRDSPKLTRDLQAQSAHWYRNHWNVERIANIVGGYFGRISG